MSKLPEQALLYHYTSAQGLLGMLGTPGRPARMWLTQVQYMNDSEEFYHAYTMAADCLTDMRFECPGARKAVSGLFGLPHEVSHQRRRDLSDFGITRLFSFSLTEMSDQLSQWRGYAPEGGCCLGFEVNDLIKMAGENGFKLLQCIYDPDQKRHLVEQCVRRAERMVEECIVDPRLRSQSSNEDDQQLAEQSARVFVQEEIAKLAESFKNSSFYEEREWRVSGTVSATDGRSRWRTRGNMIVPYCSIDISEAAGNPVPLKEVIVGPGVDFYHMKHAITFINYPKHLRLPVRPSTSSLRR
ncbi:DUF2971 domain-containing protein [Rhizobium laguerreae]|uniref:DUF2971 domain-containing protein n=1 Tax=Rhizobium laguerreae TaxID=1076926 RepID=UPI001C9140B0|nr:DUF2971 domain-containing protein [Rhizobium laguerreae]MBY3359225.1 DUF2971 domain-containing protein [Rhizobium laguerreae]